MNTQHFKSIKRLIADKGSMKSLQRALTVAFCVVGAFCIVAVFCNDFILTNVDKLSNKHNLDDSTDFCAVGHWGTDLN